MAAAPRASFPINFIGAQKTRRQEPATAAGGMKGRVVREEGLGQKPRTGESWLLEIWMCLKSGEFRRFLIVKLAIRFLRPGVGSGTQGRHDGQGSLRQSSGGRKTRAPDRCAGLFFPLEQFHFGNTIGFPRTESSRACIRQFPHVTIPRRNDAVNGTRVSIFEWYLRRRRETNRLGRCKSRG